MQTDYTKNYKNWFYEKYTKIILHIDEIAHAKIIKEGLDGWHICCFVGSIQIVYAKTIQIGSIKKYTKMNLHIMKLLLQK